MSEIPHRCPRCLDFKAVVLHHRTGTLPYKVRCYNCGHQTRWCASADEAIELWNSKEEKK